MCSLFFFFNDTATTEIYTLSLHDALPIFVVADPRPMELRRRRLEPDALERHREARGRPPPARVRRLEVAIEREVKPADRKSTRLNSSHQIISYAVFCLKKKRTKSKHHVVT